MTSRRLSRVARAHALLALCLAVGTGCATGSGGSARRRAPLPPAPQFSAEQRELLQEAERLYRDDDPAFVEHRDRLLQDPTTAFWLTRMLVLDVVRWVDGRPSDDAAFLASVAVEDETPNPLAGAAFDQLREIGPGTVPVVARDLLQSGLNERRQLGVDLLVAIGPSVLPALDDLTMVDDPALRRRVVEVAAALSEHDDAVPLLETGLADEDFRVRSAAVAGFGTRRDGERLRRVLVEEDDHFVQRVAARELGVFKDRATAVVLVDYLAEANARADIDGVRAADESLRAIAGQDRAGTLEFWRAWLTSFQEG